VTGSGRLLGTGVQLARPPPHRSRWLVGSELSPDPHVSGAVWLVIERPPGRV
jgi:hypothetical protein